MSCSSTTPRVPSRRLSSLQALLPDTHRGPQALTHAAHTLWPSLSESFFPSFLVLPRSALSSAQINPEGVLLPNPVSPRSSAQGQDCRPAWAALSAAPALEGQGPPPPWPGKHRCGRLAAGRVTGLVCCLNSGPGASPAKLFLTLVSKR